MLSVGLHKIDGIAMIQSGAQISYLPFGNFNCSITSGFSLTKVNTSMRQVYFTKLAGKITKNLWYDSYFYIGNLKDFTEGNAYVVYNISDKVTMKTGLNITYYINQTMSIGCRYDLLNRSSSYNRYYRSNNATITKTYQDKYNNHSFIFSFLWKF